MEESRKKFIAECQIRLLKEKEKRINGLKSLSLSLSEEIRGDEADIASSLSHQDSVLAQREKILFEIREIDEALGRIEEGTYGVCEETEEEIEARRLQAIPWTRLSLAGAEARERNKKRFA